MINMEDKKQVIEKIREIRFGIGLDTINLTKEQRAALEGIGINFERCL